MNIDAKFEKIMLALRTSFGLDINEFNTLFNTDFDAEYKAILSKKEKFLERNGNILKIKDEYLYVQNDIILGFMK